MSKFKAGDVVRCTGTNGPGLRQYIPTGDCCLVWNVKGELRVNNGDRDFLVEGGIHTFERAQWGRETPPDSTRADLIAFIERCYAHEDEQGQSLLADLVAEVLGGGIDMTSVVRVRT